MRNKHTYYGKVFVEMPKVREQINSIQQQIQEADETLAQILEDYLTMETKRLASLEKK